MCLALMRQIQGGNISQTNRWLCKYMLEILVNNKPWLYAQPALIPQVFYTFARIAADHSDPKYEKMRRQEVGGDAYPRSC